MTTMNWRDIAACLTVDPDLFFARELDTAAINEARATCARCPSRSECLTAAWEDGDEAGIRAGLTHRQRRVLLRKAGGDIARAVLYALADTTDVLRDLYAQQVQPTGDGHLLWTGPNTNADVRGESYTVHQIAWHAIHGRPPEGQIQRTCHIGGCVAQTCLTDRAMREQHKATA